MRMRVEEGPGGMEAQFFARLPVKMLETPTRNLCPLVELGPQQLRGDFIPRCSSLVQGYRFSLSEQKRLVDEVFGCTLYKKYAPPISYQLHFLKWCIEQAEGQSHEVCDELYELYGSLVSQPNTDNEYCFKSYKMKEDRYITLKESTNIISSGTTGLTTWEAAYHFVEWAMENPQNFNQKHVLELGCGLGLVGLALCSSCGPLSYCFTDCHPQVLTLLRDNIDINLTDLQCTPEVEVRELDWTANAEGFLATMGPVDCILATDVVYDLQVIDSFVHVLGKILRYHPKAVAYVTSTVRNVETYQHFCSKLDANCITRLKMIAPNHSMFYYNRSQHYEILKLTGI